MFSVLFNRIENSWNKTCSETVCLSISLVQQCAMGDIRLSGLKDNQHLKIFQFQISFRTEAKTLTSTGISYLRLDEKLCYLSFLLIWSKFIHMIVSYYLTQEQRMV